MKKVLSILLAFLMLSVLLAGCSDFADQKVDPTVITEPPRQIAQTLRYEATESFAGGSGTEEDPYQISDPGHLVLLHELILNQEEIMGLYDPYVDAHYILTDDISLNDTSDFDNWSTNSPQYGWEPIGADVALHSFAGVLDGNGHKITGMFIDGDTAYRARNSSGVMSTGYGLFAEMYGTVKNLTIEQAYIRASGDVGAAVGVIAGSTDYHEGAIINHCTVSAVIELYDSCDAGGVIGFAYDGIVNDCQSDVKITQLDDAKSNIGGISGTRGSVTACTFTGSISGNGSSGGILGYGDMVRDCTNLGTVTGDRAGGIVGNAFNGGVGIQIENPLRSIENCINEGRVTGTSLAGGIAASMSNSETDISMAVLNCENRGTVTCDEAAAGIIGQLSIERTDLIRVEGCVNKADIMGKGKTGGIICDFIGGILHQEGKVQISNCKNLGNIISEDQYSAGIITYFMVMGGETDLQLTVENCTNEGLIQSTTYAGGILGFSNVSFNAETSSESMKISEDTAVTLSKCINSGNITVNSSNAMAGGIVGVLGLGYMKTEIIDCVNSGAVTVDFTLTDEQIKSNQGIEWPEFYQIGGGIVGRIGDALKLTTGEGVKTSPDNVNTLSGNIKLSGCQSTGIISAPDYSFILNSNDQPLYVNYLGGIIGQCSATDGYAFGVTNCTYTGADRGLGSTQYPDVV